MSVEGTGRAIVGPVERGRTFRPAWSLAAGTGAAPRVRALWLLLAVVLAVEVVRAFMAPYSSWRMQRRLDDAAPFEVVIVWLAGGVFARVLGRRLGERRRSRRGGANWWRDRDWRDDGIYRRLVHGIQGLNVAAALAIAATATLLLLADPPSWSTNMHSNATTWGWTPNPAWFVVATYALPLAWLLVVLAPRLGRGRLLVSWPTFPQFIGGRCAFHVGTSSGGARIDGVRVFLRCIRVPHRPFLPLATWNARLVWVAEARHSLGAYVGPESHLRAEFDVPAQLPATDLHADDAVRWELLVLGTVGGADYADWVVVPVYAATA